MRARTVAWFTLLWFTLPAAAIGGQLYVSSTFPTGSGYGLSENIRAYGALVLVAPLASLGAALTGGRLRRSQVLLSGPHGRGALRVWSNVVAVPAASFTLLMWVVMAVTASSQGASAPYVDPRLAVAAALQSLAYVLFGLALGVNLPAVLAIPVAIVVPYVVIAFPPALSTYWLRHVTGVSNNCCWIYQDLPARALIAHLAFSIALSLGAAAALPTWNSRRGWWSRAALASLAVFGLLVACVSAKPLGPAANEARAGNPKCRDTSGVQLCLWPEQEQFRGDAERIVTRIFGQGAGVELPSTFTELDPAAVRWPTTSWDLSSGDPGGLLEGAIYSLYPTTQCATPDNGGGATAIPQQTPDDGTIVRAWWSGRLGLDVDDALNAGAADDEQRARFGRIEALPQAQQREEINALISRAAQVCSGVSR